MRANILALLGAVALLAGCATQGDFPSLAPRPIERMDFDEEPVRTPPDIPADAALRARAAELLALARAGERAFEAAYAPAAAAAARAGASGSDSWVTAQEAVSAAEAARADTTRALGDLDALLLERAATPTNAEDFARLRAAFEEARNLAQGQNRRIDRLKAALSP